MTKGRFTKSKIHFLVARLPRAISDKDMFRVRDLIQRVTKYEDVVPEERQEISFGASQALPGCYWVFSFPDASAAKAAAKVVCGVRLPRGVTIETTSSWDRVTGLT